ncbi:MAG: serine hydrolase domain-containing protein, partial [Pseudomonadota bacterium]
IMQLVEEGRIRSVDDPVNPYLKRYKLPPPYGDQVTIRQLMTHSSGMAGHFSPQGTMKDIPVPVDENEVALYFRENIERPPGTVGQYANLGVSLEAVLIEDLTGMSIRDYFQERLFDPMGLSPAILHHVPKPPENLAVPYGIFPNGDLQAVPFFPKHPLGASSGGVITTPEQLLKYSTLHADEEGIRFPNVLSSASRKKLHTKHFGHHPADPGIGLHFYIDDYGDTRFVSHGCGLPGTRSLMAVAPDHKAGIVVSILKASPDPSVRDLVGKVFGNGRLVEGPGGPTKEGETKGSPFNKILEAIAGPLKRPDASSFEAPSEMVDDLSQIEGVYWIERRSLTSASTFFAANNIRKVRQVADGLLKIDGNEFKRVATGVFEAIEGSARYYFRQPIADGPIYMHTSVSTSLRRMPSYANPASLSTLFSVGFLITITGIFAVFWPSGIAFGSFGKIIALLMAFAALGVAAAGTAGLETLGALGTRVSNGDWSRMAAMLGLTNLHLLLGLPLIASAIVGWSSERNSSGVMALAARVHLGILSLSALAMWPGAVFFHIIGWNLR